MAFASAAPSAFASLMLFAMVSLAACTSDIPLSSVSRLFSAFSRACDAVELLKPLSSKVCHGVRAAGWVSTPVPNKLFPFMETNVGNALELMFCEAM